MRTHTSINYEEINSRISDTLDELIIEIEGLDPDKSGEMDERWELLDIQKKLEDAYDDVETFKTKKLNGKFNN